MFFILSKVLAILVTPGFWIFVLLLLAWFKSRLRKRLLGSALLLFFFFSNGFIINLALNWWEWDKTVLPKEAKVAIVLGGYSSFNHDLNQVEFSGAVDRLLIPVQWYRSGKIDQLLLSGGSGELLKQTYSTQQKVSEFLFDSGMPKEAILVEPKSRNTRENALFTAHLIDSLDIKPSELVLVTSSFHMRRSVGCFKKVGLDIHPYPVDFYAQSVRDKATLRYLLLPDMEALVGWNYLLHEWIGYITYWIMGYV